MSTMFWSKFGAEFPNAILYNQFLDPRNDCVKSYGLFGTKMNDIAVVCVSAVNLLSCLHDVHSEKESCKSVPPLLGNHHLSI